MKWNSTVAEDDEICPCDSILNARNLNEVEGDNDDDASDGETWETAFTVFVLMCMFVALISDRIGADSVMLAALTAFMAAEIITIKEGLEGFANEGLLTVLVLFVVAEGISKTGALDWYMGKLLGNPQTLVSAQLRLMLPIAVVSAFLNNTPVVAVMIPIVQRWAKNIRMSPQQLLIPLSFASILGGTCTLIGTSTNLVVVGLLEDRYPGDSDVAIGLFDLGQYGVPIAFAGVTYVLLFSTLLLPGAKSKSSEDNEEYEDLLLGARLTQWSPAAGRTVQRSGLRETGGIYLVSVHRAATGNVHRAVSNDFVLNAGDILYFTGLVEGFGKFCQDHGLELVTNEVEATLPTSSDTSQPTNDPMIPTLLDQKKTRVLPPVAEGEEKIEIEQSSMLPAEVGVTKESLLQADQEERLRQIYRMTDMIRGKEAPENDTILTPAPKKRDVPRTQDDAAKIVVTIDRHFVVVAIDARDRSGLLLDISRALLRLNLQLHHTEAAVVQDRSISIWRCEMISAKNRILKSGMVGDGREPALDSLDIPDVEEIWSVLNALLSNNNGIEAIKKRGLRVIRARVVQGSRLEGKTAQQVDFRKIYKAAIVAIPTRNNDSTNTDNKAKRQDQKGLAKVSLSNVEFRVGDVLVLQASDDSPLLRQPPADFYQQNQVNSSAMSRNSSVKSFMNRVTKMRPSGSDGNLAEQQNKSVEVDSSEHRGSNRGQDDDFFIEPQNSEVYDCQTSLGDMDVGEMPLTQIIGAKEMEEQEAVWRDLQVLFAHKPNGGDDQAKQSSGALEKSNKEVDELDQENTQYAREFLTAMAVAKGSKLAGKSVVQIGLNKLPELFLVSIDRPLSKEEERRVKKAKCLGLDALSSEAILAELGDVETTSELEGSVVTADQTKMYSISIAQDENLREGDVLWFAGPASAIGDLRKIPGLVSNELDEVEKINEKVFDRRLVQAVIARKGPLVGKTVKEVRFRTRFGAAVISVQRDGHRVHELPGNVKLQAGDVLLLEAGPSFLAKSADKDHSFALLAEVENSAPPRLSLLIPALAITVCMLAVFTAELTSLVVSALVASILMVALGILSEQEARDAVNWEVYITIAAAFGIGTALIRSGVADAMANFLVDIGSAVGIGDAGLIGAVYFATFLISNVVTNNAAAALVFPIALNAAEQTNIDRKLMSYALMLGASASFMSPYGYTTNLLIYGPGRYKYKDFLLFGGPMQVVLWIFSTVFLSLNQTWYISWIVTAVPLVAIFATRAASGFKSSLGDKK